MLIEDLGIGQSALSYHMKILVESGVVAARQEGKWTHYSISAAGSEDALELLREITSPNEDQHENCSCVG
jgi:ArsR family transcriptional regulator